MICQRFTNQDPIGFAAMEANLYRYVFGNPVNLNDPDGEFAILVLMAAGAVAGGAVDLGLQLIQNGGILDCVDWGSVGTSAAIGGLGAIPGAGAAGAAAGAFKHSKRGKKWLDSSHDWNNVRSRKIQFLWL